jgi:hypothetical protein
MPRIRSVPTLLAAAARCPGVIARGLDSLRERMLWQIALG